jgi:hypothetical protein
MNTTPTPTAAGRAVSTETTLNFVIQMTLGRMPLQAEIDGILEQVNLFYSQVMADTFGGDFESFRATETSTNSSMAGSFTLTRPRFQAITTFAPGVEVPSQAQVDAVIQNADMTAFVENYIPNATPSGTIFANTLMVSTAIGNRSGRRGDKGGSKGDGDGGLDGVNG